MTVVSRRSQPLGPGNLAIQRVFPAYRGQT